MQSTCAVALFLKSTGNVFGSSGNEYSELVYSDQKDPKLVAPSSTAARFSNLYIAGCREGAAVEDGATDISHLITIRVQIVQFLGECIKTTSSGIMQRAFRAGEWVF